VPLTVGTAGHIDHGKTWLVRALTGKDTDRLPEERERGISIDLGYAPLDLPDGRRLSLVDVPGHERFVRNMVAGATGIDLFLLVIDAAEGARAQTHEHLAILRLLGIEHGVVAITKSDAADSDMRSLAAEEARELVPGAPVVVTSARTGEGLDELRAAIADVADRIERGTPNGATRLFVDRVFTLRGIGTVVTGTLWSGSIGEGDVLVAEPRGLEVRVRSVQVHDRAVQRAEPGQRVAVSLPGVERGALARGDALVERGAYAVTYRLDILLDQLEELADGMRLHVHHGTGEHYARLVRAGDRYAQLRLASPAVAARGDHVVLRERTTLGGGTVLDPAPPRHADAGRFELVERGEIGALVHAPVRRQALEHLTTGELAGVEEAGEWVFSPAWLERYRAEIHARLDAADPLDPGIAPPPEPWARDIEPLLGVERRGSRLYLPGSVSALGARAEAAERLEQGLDEAGFVPVKIEDAELARYLEREGRLVRLGDAFAVGTAAYAEAKRIAVEECERAGSITLARFRDLLGTGRRAAQLLLERLDADGITRRAGEERVLRRRARTG
jgi:selenocysteine-specific elongation factor